MKNDDPAIAHTVATLLVNEVEGKLRYDIACDANSTVSSFIVLVRARSIRLTEASLQPVHLAVLAHKLLNGNISKSNAAKVSFSTNRNRKLPLDLGFVGH